MEIGVVGLGRMGAGMARRLSQGRADYARRLLAMMRAEFGGHPIPRAQ
jgi:6-phosphogluconate dehydrogenase (decarboxylating)